MKPENSIPSFSPEVMPSMPRPNIEHVGDVKTPESGVETGAERFEQASESRSAANDVILTTSPIVPSDNLQNNSSNVAKVTTLSDTPLLANDEDLIEKEWVDKAKRIITETKDDPYLREEEVGKLQVDYMQKRYGRSLGSDN